MTMTYVATEPILFVIQKWSVYTANTILDYLLYPDTETNDFD